MAGHSIRERKEKLKQGSRLDELESILRITRTRVKDLTRLPHKQATQRLRDSQQIRKEIKKEKGRSIKFK